MTKRPDISELVSRAQQGSRESLGVLSALVRQRVFVYLYRMTLDYHLAEDLVQETVLYMIESLPRLETTNSLALWAWIYRSAWGKLQHYLRPQGHQRIVQKTVVDHEALSLLTDDTEQSALEQVEQSELLEAICKSLGDLQTKYRSVLILRCFDLLSYAEIAFVMGSSAVRARVLFFHARHALKRRMHNRGYGRQYFLKSLSLFGLVTGMHAKSAAAAIAVTSNLVKTKTVASVISAVIAELGLLKTAIAAIVLVAGAIYVSTSDAEKPAATTVDSKTMRDQSVLSMPKKFAGAATIDLLPEKGGIGPALPDPCGVTPYEPEDKFPAEQAGEPRSDMPTDANQPVARVDLPADPNDIWARVKSFEDLEKAIQDVGAKSVTEQRYWEQTRYDNRASLAREVQRQIEEELALARKVAVEEAAAETTTAIDALVAKRKARCDLVREELLQQRREAATGQSAWPGGRTRVSARSSGRGYYSSDKAEEPPDRDTQEEIYQWTRATTDGKCDLARMTYHKIYGEMVLIRGIAADEKADKTTVVIDGLLLARKERLDAIIKNSEEEKRRLLPGQTTSARRRGDQPMQNGRARRR